ncbi:conserved hypothetical protein, partial [Ricinus communis]
GSVHAAVAGAIDIAGGGRRQRAAMAVRTWPAVCAGAGLRAGDGVQHGHPGHVPARPVARGCQKHTAADYAVAGAGFLPDAAADGGLSPGAPGAAGQHGVPAGRRRRAAGAAGGVHIGAIEHAGTAADHCRRWGHRTRVPGPGSQQRRVSSVPRGRLCAGAG